MAVNQSLRSARKERGWSQAYLAAQLDTQAKNVSRWECGSTRPSPYFCSKLCEIFGTDTQALGLLDESLLDSPLETRSSPPPAHLQASPPIYDPAIATHPLATRQLVGRDALLSNLIEILSGGTTCVLHGLPGVGKTTLALALTSQPDMKASFPDGLLWVNLGPDPDIHTELLRLAALLQAPEAERRRDRSILALSQYVRQLLKDRRLLIVIDDVWSLEALQPLLVGGLHAVYLFTTRLLNLALALPQVQFVPVPELDAQQSSTLLNLLVPQIDDLPTETGEAIRQVLHYAGGLPLAVTLLGLHMRIQTIGGQRRRIDAALARLADTTQRLHLSFPLLSTRPPSSLASIIAISDQQLSPTAQRALRALSILPAKPESFSVEEALALCKQRVEVLAQLVDAGLLEAVGEGRYSMHQTIADYARSCQPVQVFAQQIDHEMHTWLDQRPLPTSSSRPGPTRESTGLPSAVTVQAVVADHRLQRSIRALPHVTRQNKATIVCPFCQSSRRVWAHGFNRSGSRRYRCEACCRSFTSDTKLLNTTEPASSAKVH